jgi:toxin ParE1/3/4
MTNRLPNPDQAVLDITRDANVRQIVIRFGTSGYIVRYVAEADDIVITRIWHGREARV